MYSYTSVFCARGRTGFGRVSEPSLPEGWVVYGLGKLADMIGIISTLVVRRSKSSDRNSPLGGRGVVLYVPIIFL